ncbi:hypothetical protein LINGRAHAP2_LOCUS29157, partial [Linum grandiflorum]
FCRGEYTFRLPDLFKIYIDTSLLNFVVAWKSTARHRSEKMRRWSVATSTKAVVVGWL